MTIAAVRLNHAVLFVADLERSAALLPSAPSAWRSSPASPAPTPPSCGCPARATTTTSGLFGVGRRSRRGPAARIGLYHLAWQVDTIDELEQARDDPGRARTRYTGESSHGATKSVYGAGPGRQRVRGHVDAAPRRLGRVRERRTRRPARPGRARSRAGPASARRVASSSPDSVEQTP